MGTQKGFRTLVEKGGKHCHARVGPVGALYCTNTSACRPACNRRGLCRSVCYCGWYQAIEQRTFGHWYGDCLSGTYNGASHFDVSNVGITRWETYLPWAWTARAKSAATNKAPFMIAGLVFSCVSTSRRIYAERGDTSVWLVYMPNA